MRSYKGYTVWVKKVAPLKLFAVLYLLVKLCNWKLPWLLLKHIPMSAPVLVHLYEYLCEIYHLYRSDPSFLPRCMECRRGLAMRILSVCPSVRLSVKRVHCDKTEEKSFQIFIPYERSFSLVLWEEEWLVGVTRSIWNFGSTGPPALERNRRFWTNNHS